MAEQTDASYREVAVRKARELALAFPGLEVKVAGSWVWVSGDTRPHRAELKAAGLRWAPKKGKWYLRGRPAFSRRGMPWDYIARKYGAESPEEAAAA